MKKKAFFFAFILTFCFSCSYSQIDVSNLLLANEVQNSNTHPKNIILLIGDGMGTAQIYAAYTKNHGELNMMRCTASGFSITYSADNYITDSAAGGTALSCGTKTNNGYIGIAPNGDTLTSILELAENKGLVTGLVSTSAVTHATPASFIAHQNSREMYEAIASDFLKTDVEVFIGGGYNHFTVREDGRNLVNELLKKNYSVVKNIDSLNYVTSGKLAALLAPEHMPKISEGRGAMLENSVSKAIELLNQYNTGFFLMVEGSQIDWGGHANDLEYVVNETIDFDNAVGRALEFAAKDGNTLVIVTADHETGGLTLTGGGIASGDITAVFTTIGHSAVMVPVFAFGPGSEKFFGMMQNIEIFQKMKSALGL